METKTVLYIFTKRKGSITYPIFEKLEQGKLKGDFKKSYFGEFCKTTVNRKWAIFRLNLKFPKTIGTVTPIIDYSLNQLTLLPFKKLLD